MLTTRGLWLLLTILGMLVLAVLLTPANFTLGLLALTLLLWFACQWVIFAVRSRIVSRRLRIVRHMRDEHGPVATLWAGRIFRVEVELVLEDRLDLPYLVVVDRVPFTAEVVEGEIRTEGRVATGQGLQLGYTIRCGTTGKVRFEGLRAELADLHGLFYHPLFIRAAMVYRVLPTMADAEGHTAGVKRNNLLPPPGIHRLRRPGSGTELLELRDYLPGDPPRTIAWKVSARRDRLITKEFESEVPVRCTLFVDTSSSVRVGPPGQSALAHLVGVAATVAQASAGSRDLTGLGLFDENTFSTIRPARGARHLAHLFNVLTDAAGLAPSTDRANVADLLPLAYAFAQEVYPDLMRSDVNSFPFWIPWLSPQPAWTLPRPTLRDWFYGWQRRIWILYALPPLVIGLLMAQDFFTLHPPLFQVRLWRVAVFSSLYLILGMVLWVVLSVSFSGRRRHARWRKQVAALLSLHYGLAPGGLATFQEDDAQFGQYVQRFLADHQVPCPLPLYDPKGRYLFAAPGKVEVLATALLGAIGKGHDNELYVLMADLLELGDQLDPLLRAVKVALARHHRVLVICPWPQGVTEPDKDTATRPERRKPPGDGDKETERRAERRKPPGKGMEETAHQAATQRFHRAFHQVRRTFARLGVPMVCARSGDPAQLILDRLDQLRAVGRRR